MSLLDLTDEHARMGKISNNLEIHGKEKSAISGFTLPLKLRIPRPMLVGLMGEEFDRSCWVFGPTNEISGCASWARRFLPLKLDGEIYVGVKSAIIVGGNLEPEHGRELTFEGCRVSNIEIVALAPGGITEIDCRLYVHPGIGQTNLLLQEYQEREIAVQMTMGKLRIKADKAQQDLPLNEPQASPATDPDSGGTVTEAAQEEQASTVVEGHTIVVGETANGEAPPPGFTQACESIADARSEATREILNDTEIGTPEEEREKAHAREREIAALLSEGRSHKEPA